MKYALLSAICAASLLAASAQAEEKITAPEPGSAIEEKADDNAADATPQEPTYDEPAENTAPAKAKDTKKKSEAKKPEPKKDTKPDAKAEAKPEPKTEAKPTDAPAAKEKDKKDYVVMRINGDEIKNSELKEALQVVIPGGEVVAEQALANENVRQSLLREILSKKLVYKEALKDGLDKTDSFANRLELAKRQLLIQSYVEKKTAGLLTEAALKKAYDERVKKMSGAEELKARHILVSKKDDADKIVKDLKAGGDFSKIAKEKSEDKGSGAAGGELGWFTQDKMVPEFGKAAAALKKGEVSAPIRSEFGFHIIELQDRRKLPVPSFEDMSHDLEEDVINSELEKTIAGLLDKADIQYFDAEGKSKKFERIRKKDAK